MHVTVIPIASELPGNIKTQRKHLAPFEFHALARGAAGFRRAMSRRLTREHLLHNGPACEPLLRDVPLWVYAESVMSMCRRYFARLPRISSDSTRTSPDGAFRASFLAIRFFSAR